MRHAALLLLWLAAGPAFAGPMPASSPDDPDLTLGSTCSGDPSAEDLLAAVPRRVSEMVVLWPRAGRAKAEPCRSMGRIAVVDHRGLLLTMSFVLGEPSSTGFVPWTRRDQPEDEPPPARTGPPRNEYTWVPREGTPLYVVVSGSPSTSEENLEGATSFLERGDVMEPLFVLAAR